jgi:hypothetical protein
MWPVRALLYLIINATEPGRYGPPSPLVLPALASSAAMSRSECRFPVLGERLASFRAMVTVSAGTGLRPSQRPRSARTRSLAPLSLATVIALSSCAITPRA